jgi:hypothetical protein
MSRLSVSGTVVVPSNPATRQRWAASSRSTGRSDSFGTKAVYAPEQNSRSYQKAPAGFTPVFTENVSRHGSRSATDSETAT